MKAIQLISQDVFDKIRSRFENLEMGDETGAVTIDPAEARFFDFDFVFEGNNLGRVSISLNDLGSLKIYYSQGITENIDQSVKQIWYKFLKEMRMFAMRRLMRFDTRDIAKTNLDKNDFQYLASKGTKEELMQTKMNESKWNSKSTKKTSRAVRGATEVIVRHARPVDEMYPGSRSQRKNIRAIFIQNADGERFKYPFIHPTGAFAMAQHVDHGGVPHDPAGKAIMRMSEQIAQLQEFSRQVQHSQLHDDAMGISDRAHGRLSELKSMIEALGKRHHYESWVAEFNEQEHSGNDLMELDPVTMEDYKSKFTQTNFKEELAQFFPLIHNIMQETNGIDLESYVQEAKSNCTCTDEDEDNSCPVHGEEMEESVNEFAQFEAWAEAVEQGKLADDQIEDLKMALGDLSEPLQLGPDGSIATQFFQQFGLDDSDLADKFKQAADLDSTSDPMNILQLWANESYPELLVALGMSDTGQEQQPAPEVGAQPEAEPAPVENGDMQMNPGVMEGTDRTAMIQEVAKIVKQFYNRDNPEVGPFRGNEGIAIDVEKQISEMFGEAAGQQAKAMAEAFMEKLTTEWQERHGKTTGVADDGLARLKELLGNIKQKVEGIGDQGMGGRDFNTNIMSAEEKNTQHSHQYDTTMKHADNPTYQQRMAAHDIKPGIAGYRDRIAMLKDLERTGKLKSEDVSAFEDIMRLSGLAK
jgi:hypothetical protein